MRRNLKDVSSRFCAPPPASSSGSTGTYGVLGRIPAARYTSGTGLTKVLFHLNVSIFELSSCA
jgi:hypothetical protein